MTQGELAELRGEIFGLKIILFNLASVITATARDPSATLEKLKNESLEGIVAARPANIRPAHLEAFQNAAAGIVVQAVEGLARTYSRSAPPEQIQ